MKCYNCKSLIDDDSIYCDQCGEKIFICPDCHIPGKGEGKRCGQCGKPLVAADLLGNQSKVAPVSIPSRLVSNELGITITLSDGLVIGRIEGPYASRLSSLKFLSARHASFRRDADGWIVADEGSRNGTAVNGQWCFTPLHFKTGDIVRLANSYDFTAE